MKMNIEVAYKEGFLYVPPQNFLRKTWTKRYCALYDASNHGIQRIELFESEDACVKQNPAKIIPMTDCWKVTPAPQKNQPNVFEVRTKSNSYQFSADTFQEMSEWLLSLQNVAFGKNQAKPQSLPPSEDKQEENLLYCSMDEPEVYSVRTIPTDAALRNELKGDYKFLVTSVSFSIAEENSQGRLGKIILTWPFRHIRRYGCSTENFSFEAGRKCSSGEGLFTFTTNDGLKIFQSVDNHVSTLKSTQGEGEVPNSPCVKDDRNNCFTTKDSLNYVDLMQFPSTFKSEQSMPAGPSINSEMLLNQKSNLKSLPPFRKPPRKSKPLVSEHGGDNGKTNTTFSDSQNLYGEILRRNSSDTMIRHSDVIPSRLSQTHVYHAPNATKTLDKTDLSALVENMSVNKSPKNEPMARRASALDYENCGPKFENPFQSSRPVSHDHVYGRINNIQNSIPIATGNIYGSIISSPPSTDPVYSNISYPKESHEEITDKAENPSHFMKNEAEYAQILKKNKTPQ